MKTITSNRLEDRIPSLVEPLAFLHTKLGRNQCKGDKDFQMKLYNLASSDFLLEVALSESNSPDITSMCISMHEALPVLQSFAIEYPQFLGNMRAYLSRLKSFSEKDKEAASVYKAYQQAFRGAA